MFKDELKLRTARVEEIVYSYLPPEEGYQKVVMEAMNYSMKAGGKRLRPLMMLETFRLCGGSAEEESMVYPFMAAIEMIHTYSLIHDDLPALDNDDYRRGRKTSHVVFGEAMAILAGDALLNYAFETACKAFEEHEGDVRVSRALTILAKKPGINGMIGGQVVDVAMTGKKLSREQLCYIYENKTGALIEAAMMIGAVLAGAGEETLSEVEALASDIGMAFQIQDDFLDVYGDSSVTGKPVLSDEENGKITMLDIYGPEEAARQVKLLSEQAAAGIDKLGTDGEFLRELIISLISRDR